MHYPVSVDQIDSVKLIICFSEELVCFQELSWLVAMSALRRDL